MDSIDDQIARILDAGYEPCASGIPGQVGFRVEPPVPWPAQMTPAQRGDLRRVCVEIKRLTDRVESDGATLDLWRAAHECLSDLRAYGDAHA